MKTLFKAARAAACVSMSALGLTAVASSVQASEIRIFIADLDLQTPGGVAVFHERVDAVARQMCAGRERLRDMDHSVCVRAVREEAKDNLARELEKAASNGAAATASAGR